MTRFTPDLFADSAAELTAIRRERKRKGVERGGQRLQRPAQLQRVDDRTGAQVEVLLHQLGDFFVGDLADLLQQLAVSAIDFGLLRHLKKLVRARVPAGVNAVPDTRNQLFVCQPFLDGRFGNRVEVGVLLFPQRWCLYFFAPT